MVIQESAEMYLETIISLQNKKGNVRAIDISREMGFSRPTVSIAVHKLEENGFERLPDWKDALGRYLRALQAKG